MLEFFQKIGSAIGGVVYVIFMIAWMFGGFIGAIYWAVEDELVNVVLSIFIPLYGAISMAADLL